MEQKLLGQHLVLEVYPSSKEVLKRTVGQTLRVYARINPDFVSKGKIIVEAWCDINSGRFHAVPLRPLDESDVYYADIHLVNTGFYKLALRWRLEDKQFWTWNTGWHEPGQFTQIHVDPEYINDSIVYNAFVRFFGQRKVAKDGEVKFGSSGTFDDLKYRLDELKAMGVDILYLNPIHPIGELYRNYNPHDHFPKHLQPGCPYSVKDYKAIDPELGVDRDGNNPHSSISDPMREFKELVDAAHKRGIKVYMDLVFNHTSHDFVLQRLHPEWFLYKENIKSLDAPYLYPEEVKNGKPWGDQAHTFCPFDHGYWWDDTAQLNWEYLLPPARNDPPKNPTLKEMFEYFKSIPKYWINHFGIDGFRCDVAYRIPPRFWKECIREARDFAKEVHPKNGSLSGDVVFIGESYVDDLNDLFESGFTAVYGDFSNKLYNPLSLKGYVDYMLNMSGNHFPDGAKFFIFPECHDFLRNTKRLLSQVGHDATLSERANQSRWLLTATLPGIPMIFNGFEKLEWHPVNLFSYSAIDWESDRDLKKFITKVNRIRHACRALQAGDYTYLDTSQGLHPDSQLFCFARTNEHEKIIVCVNMNLHNEARGTVYLPRGLGIPVNYEITDLLTGRTYRREGSELFVILKPGEGHVFKVKRS